MTPVPTRWKTTFQDQLEDATRRLDLARTFLRDGNGGRALQETYPAVVAAATVRVWLVEPPWEQAIAPSQMQRRVRDEFPNLFSALASLDITDVLTSPWTVAAAEPYVEEASAFLQETNERFRSWVEEG